MTLEEQVLWDKKLSLEHWQEKLEKREAEFKVDLEKALKELRDIEKDLAISWAELKEREEALVKKENE